MRRKAKVDKNQPEVVGKLRDAGFTVALTHQLGQGFPDFVIAYAGLTCLVELKSDEKKKLTKDEGTFCDTWNGHIIVESNAANIAFNFYNWASGHINSDYILGNLEAIIVMLVKGEEENV